MSTISTTNIPCERCKLRGRAIANLQEELSRVNRQLVLQKQRSRRWKELAVRFKGLAVGLQGAADEYQRLLNEIEASEAR